MKIIKWHNLDSDIARSILNKVTINPKKVIFGFVSLGEYSEVHQREKQQNARRQ